MAVIRPTTVMTISLDQTEIPGETQVDSPEGAKAQADRLVAVVDRLVAQVVAVEDKTPRLLEDLPMEEVVNGMPGIKIMGFPRLPASPKMILSCCWPGPACSRPKY